MIKFKHKGTRYYTTSRNFITYKSLKIGEV